MWRTKEDAVRDFMKFNGDCKESEAILNEALSEPKEDEDSDGYGNYIDTRTGEKINVSSSESDSTEDLKGWGRGKIIKSFKDNRMNQAELQMVKSFSAGNYMIERYFANIGQKNLERKRKKADSKNGAKKKVGNEEKNQIENSEILAKEMCESYDESSFMSFTDADDEDDADDNDDKNAHAASASSVAETPPKSQSFKPTSSGSHLVTRSPYINFRNISEDSLKYISIAPKSNEEQSQKMLEDKRDVKDAKTTGENQESNNQNKNRSYYSLATEIIQNRRRQMGIRTSNSESSEYKEFFYPL